MQHPWQPTHSQTHLAGAALPPPGMLQASWPLPQPPAPLPQQIPTYAHTHHHLTHTSSLADLEQQLSHPHQQHPEALQTVVGPLSEVQGRAIALQVGQEPSLESQGLDRATLHTLQAGLPQGPAPGDLPRPHRLVHKFSRPCRPRRALDAVQTGAGGPPAGNFAEGRSPGLKAREVLSRLQDRLGLDS